MGIKYYHLPWSGLACIPFLLDRESYILLFRLLDTIRTWNPRPYLQNSSTWLSTRLIPSRDGKFSGHFGLPLPCNNVLLSYLRFLQKKKKYIFIRAPSIYFNNSTFILNHRPYNDVSIIVFT